MVSRFIFCKFLANAQALSLDPADRMRTEERRERGACSHARKSPLGIRKTADIAADKRHARHAQIRRKESKARDDPSSRNFADNVGNL